MRQIDSSDLRGIGDDVVGFVEAIDVFRGSGHHQWVESRYYATVYRRPLRIQDRPLAICHHEHREIDRAARCVRQLLRATT